MLQINGIDFPLDKYGRKYSISFNTKSFKQSVLSMSFYSDVLTSEGLLTLEGLPLPRLANS